MRYRDAGVDIDAASRAKARIKRLARQTFNPRVLREVGPVWGWVRRRQMRDGSRIRPGDVILGLPSLGLHTNGYSLARKVLLEQAGMKLAERVPELGRTLGDELLAPHRCYWPRLEPLL